MSDLHGYSERLAAIANEIVAMEDQRHKSYADIGERAFPELRDKPEFAESVAKVDKILAYISELKQKEAELLAEKEKREEEERERIAKLTCFTCKTVNSEGSKFCERCGKKLGEPPREYCKACGTMNQPTMKFCGECGQKLDEAS